MKLLIAITLALCSVYYAAAASSGLLAYCLIDTVKYGKGTSIMPWVQPVANATFYTIRTGDLKDTTTDPVSYTPGKLIPIHIRTLDLNRIFIGMVLYAVNSAGKKVGTWTIPTGAPFQTAPLCEAADGVASSVVHSDADLKPLHVVFWWQAPAGTGSVTFRILIKQGEQNKGWFWYPAKVLKLTEGTAPTDNQYVLANIGQTCKAACATQGSLPFCDATATSYLRGQNSMAAPIVAAGAACLLPLLSGCSDMAPFRTSDFHCFYKTDTSVCTENGRGLMATDANVCTYADTTGQRFCACTSVNGSDVITGVIPTTDSSNPDDDSTGTDGLSGAMSSHSASFVSYCLLAVSSLLLINNHNNGGSASRSTVAMMIVLLAVIAMVVVPTADAHNWIGNPSRATIASVTKPCQRRVGDQPHIQVTKNQVFQNEWSVGHGDSRTKMNYWVAVHADDYDNLLTMTTADLDAYIAQAPTSAWKFNATMWKKRHITSTSDPAWIWGYFDRTPLAKNDSRYIARDPVMNTRGKIRYSNNNFNEYFFYPNHTYMDARVEYASAKYPWIESVHRFWNSFAEHDPFAHQYNLANFKLAARKGPGDYVLHWYWGGYRDCVDINVQPGDAEAASPVTIANRYGVVNASASTTFIKMEHCEFFFVMNPLTTCTLVPASNLNAKVVLDACNKYGTGCTAVQCARLNNPSTSMTWTPGIPYTIANSTQFAAAIGGPCGSASIDARTNTGCAVMNKMCNETTLRLQSTSVDDQVCFGLQPYRNQDLQASEDFTITDDPLDPRWYSTCWFKVAQGGFLNVPAIANAFVPWKAGDQCITCAARKAAQASAYNTVMNWVPTLTSTCINCESPDL